MHPLQRVVVRRCGDLWRDAQRRESASSEAARAGTSEIRVDLAAHKEKVRRVPGLVGVMEGAHGREASSAPGLVHGALKPRAAGLRGLRLRPWISSIVYVNRRGNAWTGRPIRAGLPGSAWEPSMSTPLDPGARRAILDAVDTLCDWSVASLERLVRCPSTLGQGAIGVEGDGPAL